MLRTRCVSGFEPTTKNHHSRMFLAGIPLLNKAVSMRKMS